MINNHHLSKKQEEIISYLIAKTDCNHRSLPSIKQMSLDLKISTANLREHIAFLKTIGVLEAKPRNGIRLLDYQLTPALAKSLFFAVKLDKDVFNKYSDIRNHLEKSFFIEASKCLTSRDNEQLKLLVTRAKEKLLRDPIQIPHQEHREFHLQIYRPLNNIFLIGMLEAYWDTYEMIGLDVYADLSYLKKVWDYHQMILERLADRDYQAGYELLIDHMELIFSR